MMTRNYFKYYGGLSREVEKRQIQKMLFEQLKDLEPDKYYSVKWSKKENYDRATSANEIMVSVEIEETLEKRTFVVTQEDFHFSDYKKRTFFGKLKACFRYMKDKTGNKISY